ncbi:MAG: 30S ribosomal protein S5 [Candidatus Ratteibacteria bacterium]|nr:30S ribosomal protein S5 [Candidatus Ratteibacteria bacterium]
MEQIKEKIKEEVEQVTFKEKVVYINRVGKVAKGGRKIAFNAVVVVGDGNGNVGYGLGKAPEVSEAIRKGVKIATKNMVKIPIKDNTIPAQVIGKYIASTIVLRPAFKGTGIIAGAPARAVLELAGIKDVLTKSLGSNNPLNVIKATLNGLKKIDKDIQRYKMRTEKK